MSFEKCCSGFAYSTKETQQHSFDMGKYVIDNNIKGDIVECGVAAAGNFGAMIFGCLTKPEGKERKYWGFDSFEGIQLAGKKDTLQAGIGLITHDVNVPDEDLLVSSGITSHTKEYVESNLKDWGLDDLNIKLVEGWVQHTIPKVIKEIKSISILRLDMDIYAPTKFTLEQLYPLITKGGVIIIDDWELDGARIACEEYFSENNIKPELLSIPNSSPLYFFKP
jgi:O-methyltransferase